MRMTGVCSIPSLARSISNRVNLIAAWREATVFTEAEKAALELAEQDDCTTSREIT
jgi:hypothetical protein